METEKNVQSRREFCANACSAATAVVAGTWLSACGGSPTAPGGESAVPLPAVASSVAGRTISVTLANAPALTNVGSAGLAQTSVGDFLITRASQDAFTVLTATCTHEGCTITGFASPRFVCPCHGSQFTTIGEVAGGPASRPLRAFASQIVDGILTFTV
jgi:Rieske Fe-S protein